MSNKQTFKIYVVTAYKFGERDNHSYVVAAFTSKDKAIECADHHTKYRGDKYACHVEELLNNEYDPESDYDGIIYKTKSFLCEEEDF